MDRWTDGRQRYQAGIVNEEGIIKASKKHAK